MAKGIKNITVSHETRKSHETWKKDSFCHKFLVDKLQKDIPVCNQRPFYKKNTYQVRCLGSMYTNSMVLCVYMDFAVRPQEERGSRLKYTLLQSTRFRCEMPHQIDNIAYKNSYPMIQTNQIVQSTRTSPFSCGTWINKTALFYSMKADASNSYNMFMDLYNIHQTIADYGYHGEYQLIQLLESSSSGFDKVLFPNAISMNSLYHQTVCFKRVVWVPKSKNSALFRCAVDVQVHKRCLECHPGSSETSMSDFRNRVLKACDIRDHKDSISTVVAIMEPDKSVFSSIRKFFPQADLKYISSSHMTVCENVKVAVEADVLIGSDLSHVWWMRRGTLALELKSNKFSPDDSYKVLASVLGLMYKSAFESDIMKILMPFRNVHAQ